MRDIKRNQITRWFLLILLSALFLFELHAVLASFSLLEGTPYQEQFVLRSAAVDQLCPIRLPEKITLHEEASKDWEQWNKRGSRQITVLLIFCIVFSFLLLSRVTVLRRIPESTNLPHIRVLRFIHQKDGKGPEKSTLLR